MDARTSSVLLRGVVTSDPRDPNAAVGQRRHPARRRPPDGAVVTASVPVVGPRSAGHASATATTSWSPAACSGGSSGRRTHPEPHRGRRRRVSVRARRTRRARRSSTRARRRRADRRRRSAGPRSVERAHHEAGPQLRREERRLRRHQQALTSRAFDLGDADRPDQHGGGDRVVGRRSGSAARRRRAGTSPSARRAVEQVLEPHAVERPDVVEHVGRGRQPRTLARPVDEAQRAPRVPSRPACAGSTPAGGLDLEARPTARSTRSSTSMSRYTRWIASTLSWSATSSLTNASVSSAPVSSEPVAARISSR